MSKIVFICDLEEGHLLPTFRLASTLQQRGHQVIYLSVSDNEHLVKEQGFDFQVMLENHYPKGLRQMIRKKFADNSHNAIKFNHLVPVTRGAYDVPLRKLNADLYLVSYLLPLDILVLYYKYNIRPVVFTPFLRDVNITVMDMCIKLIDELPLEEKCLLLELLASAGDGLRSFREVVAPLGRLTELIFCPAEFEIDRCPDIPTVHRVEPSIRKSVMPLNIYEMYSIPGHKKIIYASMGSQALRHGAVCDQFFTKMINVMAHDGFDNLHLILCIDKTYDRSKLGAIPANVTILDWAPQIDVLKVASVAIVHGGLGSVKECIYFGVPMIVFPQAYDQPHIARCVAQHRLGFFDNIGSVTEEKLCGYIAEALTNAEIKAAVKRMQAIFHAGEKKEAGADIIEKSMQSNSGNTAFLRTATYFAALRHPCPGGPLQ